jgi:hypothetical protein
MSIGTSDLRRRIAVIFLRIEGILILTLGVALIIKGLITDGAIEWFVISGILFLALSGGIGLLLAATGLKNRKMYGRAPAVLANLIAVGVSKYMFEAGLWWVAMPLTLYAAITIYCVLTIEFQSPTKNRG